MAPDDYRAIILHYLLTSGHNRAWLAREAGLTAAKVNEYLAGKHDMHGTTLAKLLDACGYHLKRKS